MLGRDCADVGGRLHTDVYSDVRSASEFATRPRDDFPRLLEDLRTGQFGAQVLPLWEGSRGSRQMREWVELLDLLKLSDVWLWIHTHERLFNPRLARDRRDLINEGADAEMEPAKSSERLRRDLGELAADGHPHASVRYGYRRLYDPKTGALVRDEPDPVESLVIKELFQKFYDGELGIGGLASYFESKGVLRRNGEGPFVREHLRNLLTNPGYAGFRVHNPERSRSPYLSSEDPRLSPAKWEAIIDPKLFFEVQQILANPTRKTTKPSRGKHLVSMIGVCDVCDEPLRVGPGPAGRHVYRCQRGCVSIGKDPLEEFAEESLLRYLERPGVQAKLRRGNEAAAGVAEALERQLVDARGELETLKADVKSGKLKVSYLAEFAPNLEERIAGLFVQIDEVSTPTALRGFVGGNVRKRWSESPVPRRREVVREIFSPDWAGQFRLCKSPPRRAFSPAAPPVERVTFRRLADTEPVDGDVVDGAAG